MIVIGVDAHKRFYWDPLRAVALRGGALYVKRATGLPGPTARAAGAGPLISPAPAGRSATG